MLPAWKLWQFAWIITFTMLSGHFVFITKDYSPFGGRKKFKCILWTTAIHRMRAQHFPMISDNFPDQWIFTSIFLWPYKFNKYSRIVERWIRWDYLMAKALIKLLRCILSMSGTHFTFWLDAKSCIYSTFTHKSSNHTARLNFFVQDMLFHGVNLFVCVLLTIAVFLVLQAYLLKFVW